MITGHHQLTTWLVNNNVDLSKTDDVGKTALHYMIQYNFDKPERIKKLISILSQHPDWVKSAEILDDGGAGPLHVIASGDDREIFDLLVSTGWDPLFETQSGKTAQYLIDQWDIIREKSKK